MSPAIDDGPITVYNADVLAGLAEIEAESVQTVVTSPPYWGLRDYGVEGQIGLEPSPEEFIDRMVEVFAAVRRVLRKDGTLWLNIGDSWEAGTHSSRRPTRSLEGYGKHGYWTNPRAQQRSAAGLKRKDLIGIPWMLAFALRADGWWLRQDIIWSKPNPMPESVTDRPTKAHEYLFLLTRSPRYYYNADALRTAFSPETKALSFETMDFARRDGYKAGERPLLGPTVKNADKPPQDGHRRLVESVKMARAAGGDHEQPFGLGANARSVWTIATRAYPDAHFATFPEKLVEPCIKAGSREGDLVLDPFAGSGTTLAVARRLGRRAVGIELNPEYVELIRKRVGAAALPLLEEIT